VQNFEHPLNMQQQAIYIPSQGSINFSYMLM